MANVTKAKDVRIAYVCDEAVVRQFALMFSEITPNIQFEIACLDDTIFKYSSIEDVISFPNSPSRRIVSLIIRTPLSIDEEISLPSFGDEQPSRTLTIPKLIDPQAYIKFRETKSKYGNTIGYYVYGDDVAKTLYYLDMIEQRVSGLVLPRWYSFIADLDMVLAIAVLFVLLNLPNSIGTFSSLPSLIAQLSVLSSTQNGVVILAILAMVLLVLVGGAVYYIVFSWIGGFLNRLKNSIFPTVTFAIGAGIQRHQRNAAWRTTVMLSGIILPIVATVLYAVILALFQR